MPTTVVKDEAENQRLAEELYNLLMVDIEPDLLIENIPGLDAKYAGETPEQHTARMQRYDAAYKKFDEEFNKFMVDVDHKVRTTRRDSLHEKEQEARKDEENTINSLASAFR
jgi:hypothetical protein